MRNVGCKAAAEPATQDEVAAAVQADPSVAAVPSDSNGKPAAVAGTPTTQTQGA